MSVISGALGQEGGWKNRSLVSFPSAKEGESDT